MRDPRRIKRILTLFQQIWEYQPDVRFNQLISNLQSIYSQQHDNYGRREVFSKGFIEFENTVYLDFFFLEDDKWEEFLKSYLASIEETLIQRRKKLDDKLIDEVTELFVEVGIEGAKLNSQFKNKIRGFLLKESKSLTVEKIIQLVRNFGQEERLELFEKISRYY